jgi:hypothetical protein
VLEGVAKEAKGGRGVLQAIVMELTVVIEEVRAGEGSIGLA